jgi:hypothetical protein
MPTGEFMEISKHIIIEVKKIIALNQSLPAQISSAPEFYIAQVTDLKVLGFAVVQHDGKQYKIGTKK